MLIHDVGMRRFVKGDALAADLGRYANTISES
jgi:hypothetical protein